MVLASTTNGDCVRPPSYLRAGSSLPHTTIGGRRRHELTTAAPCAVNSPKVTRRETAVTVLIRTTPPAAAVTRQVDRRSAAVEVMRGGALGVRMQSALLGQVRNRGADRRMHPARAVQVLGRYRWRMCVVTPGDA